MKKIVKLTETVDNNGRTKVEHNLDNIKNHLLSPEEWTDDILYFFEVDGKDGVCFVDELVGYDVMVGDEVIHVNSTIYFFDEADGEDKE